MNIARRFGARWLLAALLIPLVTACDQIPLQPRPLTGEGPPPGYVGGDIPDQYRGLRNPFTLEDQQALEAGRRLYHAYAPSCAACHGDGGRGDGPMAPYLEPQPADFAAPLMLRALREHQDYLFWWVSEGVPRTAMPAWKERMSETERWQVITYAWYLGEVRPSPPTPLPAGGESRRGR